MPQVRVLPGAPLNKGQKLKKTELLAFSFSLIFSLACHRLAKTSRLLQNIAPKIAPKTAPGFTPKMATVTKRKRKKGFVYKAEIRMKGFPCLSQTFDRLSEAQRWAEDTESLLRSGGQITDNDVPEELTFVQLLPLWTGRAVNFVTSGSGWPFFHSPRGKSGISHGLNC